MSVNLRFLLPLLALSTVTYAQSGPIKVEVKQINGRYELLRGGQPYFIKGAGGGQFPERVKAYGGNSIRTWSTEGADVTLAEANKNGLTVMLGLDVARERHGFDYNNPQAVAEQLQKVRAEVLKYKDNPAVLFWGIGNELNLEYTNPKVWDAVQQIAQMIHEVDPNHPTSTVLAGLNQKEVDLIKAKCPAVDILSINTYAGLAAIPQQVRSTGWTGPYVVAEWGPTGHWESPVTPWKASVEETSSQKAAVYQSRYEASVAKDKTQCLGTYVFLWGQKQERTPTWYGIFTEDGKESEVVDVMQYLWSGQWPENRAPHLAGFRLNGQQATDSVYLQPGKSYPAIVTVTDPDKDRLTYRWELLPESTDLKSGGDRESRPEPIAGLIPKNAKAKINLKAPEKEGAYRLFIYTYDGHDNVATANIPFYVKGK
ncbi:glycoside hydrolase family 2 TIM barrel-domain containing protein [Hymenobacter sp. BT730]|uniref:glycoside hydrolase family 2 TIM barrel-domain containing protein n=1 Tax=Hymenobacter sp. BT730 TaxID=3063332 RepID=UPI0026DF12C8|nr:glycoside hydrolase family 2 TIM barrel-domain containing protein [Hymenobacter sp. BT730]